MRRSERGYAMIALLVAMSVMAIMLGVALPAWRTYAQREREAELVFRGEQYARAITLFQRKYANASPPNLDVLVTERFLRKKYKDPITGDDFQIVAVGAAQPGDGTAQPGRGGTAAVGQQAQDFRQTIQQAQESLRQVAQQTGGTPGRAGGGGIGIAGVTSKSPEKSFRLYRGRDTYNQWVFVGVQTSTRAGGPGGRAGQTGTGRGNDGRGIQQPAGRGLPPPPGGRGAQPPQTPGAGRGFGGRNFPD